MADIFLSYAKGDRKKAELLANAIEMQGWTVFWKFPTKLEDSSLEELRNKAKEAFENSKCFIALWTKNSVNSYWVRAMANEGLIRKTLISVTLEDVRVPSAYSNIQAERFLNWEGKPNDPQFKKLLKKIEDILGTSPLKVREI